MDRTRGIVLFGDVVHSRRDAAASTDWLRTLRRALDDAYGEACLAPFGFTQGDELQGLLTPDADPLLAVLLAGLHPSRRKMRWAIVEGDVDAGSGPATERSGAAFLAARSLIERSRVTRDGLMIRTGEPGADHLLDQLAPPFAEMLDGLTERQRDVGWQVLVEGRRQADVAAALGVSRATISVTYARGRIRSIERMATAIRAIVGAGRQALTESGTRRTETAP